MTESPLPWQTYESETPLQPQGSYTCEHCHLSGPWHQAPWGCIPALRREVARLASEYDKLLAEQMQTLDENERLRAIVGQHET